MVGGLGTVVAVGTHVLCRLVGTLKLTCFVGWCFVWSVTVWLLVITEWIDGKKEMQSEHRSPTYLYSWLSCDDDGSRGQSGAVEVTDWTVIHAPTWITLHA